MERLIDMETYEFGGKKYILMQSDNGSCEGCAFDNSAGDRICDEEAGQICTWNTHFVKAYETTTESKETNPKDAVGVRKAPMSVVPSAVVMEMGLGMMEGARKYGRHNYRKAGVRASVYYDAAQRHLMDWWEGTDIDEASGLSHVTKAMTALAVLRDAMMNDMWTDDRPPPMKNKQWLTKMNAKAGAIIDQYPNALEPFTKENT